MNVLVIGSGAREHALAWKLHQDDTVDSIIAAPGNAGTAALGTNFPIAVTAALELAELAVRERVGLAVVGPEAALAAGVADALRRAGVPTFGPDRAAARLETSKAFAKRFMRRYGIPTANAREAHDLKQAERAIALFASGIVLKADGLAAGKGVVVCADAAQAGAVIAQWYGARKLPGGGSTIVIEERLEGPEVSVMALVDGRHYRLLASACDYKRAHDGDAGPNTGGMGAYSPAADVLDEAKLADIARTVFEPAIEGLRSEGLDYRGCLYAGLMLTSRGPVVLEFNARFGDPETQVVLPRLRAAFGELLLAAASGELERAPAPQAEDQACVGIVLASPGYPQQSEPRPGLPLPRADSIAFWGTSALARGTVDAAGGRVLTMCALGEDIAQARQRAYDDARVYVGGLRPDQALRYRSDIGERAVVPVR
jgi:phosphoribosylamine--glycine ligase